VQAQVRSLTVEVAGSKKANALGCLTAPWASGFARLLETSSTWSLLYLSGFGCAVESAMALWSTGSLSVEVCLMADSCKLALVGVVA